MSILTRKVAKVQNEQETLARLLGYTGSNWYEVRIDDSTRAINTIEYAHHEIHSGSHYVVAGYDTFAADGDIDFQVTTPNTTKWAHMFWSIQATGQTTLKIYEDADYDADGSAVTARNSDRNSSNTSGLVIQTDGTVNTNGTLIYSQAFGFLNTPSKIQGGDTRAENELILKQNTKYRFFIESDSADNIISWIGHYYEHTNNEA